MKILVDMNLSPEWVEFFQQEDIGATHWSAVGAIDASDVFLMTWARANGYIVFTHDLDFGMLLAITGAEGPSVIQVRTQDVLSERVRLLVLASIRTYRAELLQGAILTIDEFRSRVKILPIQR